MAHNPLDIRVYDEQDFEQLGRVYDVLVRQNPRWRGLGVSRPYATYVIGDIDDDFEQDPLVPFEFVGDTEFVVQPGTLRAIRGEHNAIANRRKIYLARSHPDYTDEDTGAVYNLNVAGRAAYDEGYYFTEPKITVVDLLIERSSQPDRERAIASIGLVRWLNSTDSERHTARQTLADPIFMRRRRASDAAERALYSLFREAAAADSALLDRLAANIGQPPGPIAMDDPASRMAAWRQRLDRSASYAEDSANPED